MLYHDGIITLRFLSNSTLYYIIPNFPFILRGGQEDAMSSQGIMNKHLILGLFSFSSCDTIHQIKGVKMGMGIDEIISLVPYDEQ